MRLGGRKNGELREISITRRYTKYAEGSVLIEFGDTKVLCNASVEDSVPRFLKGKGQGWVTAEYGMIPRSTDSRMEREATRSQRASRSIEIQRLIGRSLRAIVDLKKLGERTIKVDCDVLQADGGTRCAALTGASVALADAGIPMRDLVAGCAAGKAADAVILDVNNEEDQAGQADLPIGYMPNLKKITLLQLDGVLTPEEYKQCIEIGIDGCNQVYEIQKKALQDKFFASGEKQ